MAAASTKAIAKRTRFDAGAVSRSRVVARYDAAQRTDENANLWAGVDGLSAASANTPEVRKIVRDRARYEVANSPYAAGMISTLANDIVGPEIQIQLGDSEGAQRVETDFQAWASAVNLWQKCRTLMRAKPTDGEAFALLFSNPKVEDDIKLDVRPIECDMVEGYFNHRENEIDGIRFDGFGNPTDYRLLKNHPGDYRFTRTISTGAGDWIRRRYMLHMYTETRPGQVRGLSEIVPALNLFGQLRRYTSAVIEAAQRAAEIAAIMYTDLLPDQVAAELADPVTVMDIERNAIMSLPEGWRLEQLKSEQPATTYAMFKAEIINEIARCMNMPFNIAAGNSSGYNYASGRLDHQTYDRSVQVARHDLARQALDRIYAAWLEEYGARKALSREVLAEVATHEWHFSGRGHVDPAKEANADNTRLQNGTLTHADYWAKQGADWKRKESQRIREMIHREIEWNRAREAASLPPAPYPYGQPVAQLAGPTPDEVDDDDGNDGSDGEPTGKGLDKWLT